MATKQTTDEKLERPEWCKIVTSAKHGPVLVTRDYEEADGSGEGEEKVKIEFRSNICMVLTWSFLSEDEAQAAFDKLDDTTIDTLRAPRVMDCFADVPSGA